MTIRKNQLPLSEDNTEVNGMKIYQFIFALTIWVFLSLNAKSLNFKFYEIFRFILPVLLIIFTPASYKNGSSFLPLILLFLIGVAPACYLSPYRIESILKACSFVLVLQSMFICFMRITQKESEKLMEMAFRLLILFQILNLFYFLIGGAGINDRTSGFTTNANSLGIYSNLAFWASYIYYKKHIGLKQGFALGMMLICILLALASGSRSAFVTILLNSVIVTYLSSYNTTIRIFVIFFSAFLIFLLFSGFFDFLTLTALQRLLEEGGMERGAIWDDGLDVWRRSPIFGVGYRVSKYFNREVGLEFHNSYLTLLADTGIWGCCMLALGLVPSLVKIWKHTLHFWNDKSHIIFISVSFMCLSLLLNAWSESFLFSVGSTEAFMFWMLFVWLVAYMQKNKKEALS